MQEIIHTQSSNDDVYVKARDAYNYLGIKRKYADCIKSVLRGLDAEKDFFMQTGKSKIGRPLKEHFIHIDIAKHIMLLSRSEKAKEARRYFIEIEKASRRQDDEKISEYREEVNKHIKQLEEEIERLKSLSLPMGEIVEANPKDMLLLFPPVEKKAPAYTFRMRIVELVKSVSQKGGGNYALTFYQLYKVIQQTLHIRDLSQNGALEWLEENGYDMEQVYAIARNFLLK